MTLSKNNATSESPINSTISTYKAKRVFRLALEYAVLAPSSHNTQPWLFRINENTLELYADKERTLKTIDPNHRELIMSCGAALYTLRLTLRSFGYAEKTELLPNPNSEDLLARVTLTGVGGKCVCWYCLTHLDHGAIPDLWCQASCSDWTRAYPRNFRHHHYRCEFIPVC